jgi:signal transduction histidine kinase
MRTQQHSQVEAIVAKYETHASNTDKVKSVKKECEDHFDIYVPTEFMRLNFGEQLIARIYELRAGKDMDSDVKKKYSEASSFYIKGLLNEEEERYLVDNFDEFVDYAFEHFNTSFTLSWTYDIPTEWSCLVPYLLEKKSGKIFIPNSDKGREFIGLNNCDITVGYGYEDAAIRALACGLDIHPFMFCDSEELSLSNIADGQFNAVIADFSNSQSDIQTHFIDFLRIVKDDGDLLLCISKEAVLSEETSSLRSQIVASNILQEVIQLPSGNILLHCVKKDHDSVVMCDASGLSKRSNERVVDVDAFQKEVRMADLPEREDCPVIRRYSYDKVNENMLLPVYYLRPNFGTPVSQIVTVAEDFVLSDECNPSEKVVTVNHLSNVFTKGAFKVENLACVNLDRMRLYYRVEGPAVIMAVSEQNIAIGYTADSSSFLVPRNLYALKPLEGIDVKYLASMLISNHVSEQLIRLVFGKGISARLAFRWSEYTLMELHSEQEQQAIVQNAILEDYASQEHYMALQEKGFKHAMRLRKHALSQNISAFDSLFRSLEYCMSEHKGELKASVQLSPVSPITVADAMGILHSNLQTICERVNHLTDDQDWGPCEAIEPQQFIEDYEKHHSGMDFRFSHLWEDFETNHFEKDVFDKKTGKLIFHKGESMNAAWFPGRALKQVFDNILSNAREHGFTDKSRQDYVLQTSWSTDGLNMLIKVANNGAPLPSDLNTDLVLEYGYTTALNQRGHAGIGGGEMAEIMHKFGGDIRVISTPDKKFTVTYVLSMPLASIY